MQAFNPVRDADCAVQRRGTCAARERLSRRGGDGELHGPVYGGLWDAGGAVGAVRVLHGAVAPYARAAAVRLARSLRNY